MWFESQPLRATSLRVRGRDRVPYWWHGEKACRRRRSIAEPENSRKCRCLGMLLCLCAAFSIIPWMHIEEHHRSLQATESRSSFGITSCCTCGLSRRVRPLHFALGRSRWYSVQETHQTRSLSSVAPSTPSAEDPSVVQTRAVIVDDENKDFVVSSNNVSARNDFLDCPGT